jgi:Arc/MetJ-type ribon-helix-helix transcriptional regulator
MTIHLPENVEISIREAVHRGHFSSLDDAMTEAAQLLLEKLKHGQTVPPMSAAGTDKLPSAPQSILEMVDDLRKNVPPEELAKLPTDGAAQHDHYIYRTPRRPTA